MDRHWHGNGNGNGTANCHCRLPLPTANCHRNRRQQSSVGLAVSSTLRQHSPSAGSPHWHRGSTPPPALKQPPSSAGSCPSRRCSIPLTAGDCYRHCPQSPSSLSMVALPAAPSPSGRIDTGTMGGTQPPAGYGPCHYLCRCLCLCLCLWLCLCLCHCHSHAHCHTAIVVATAIVTVTFTAIVTVIATM